MHRPVERGMSVHHQHPVVVPVLEKPRPDPDQIGLVLGLHRDPRADPGVHEHHFAAP